MKPVRIRKNNNNNSNDNSNSSSSNNNDNDDSSQIVLTNSNNDKNNPKKNCRSIICLLENNLRYIYSAIICIVTQIIFSFCLRKMKNTSIVPQRSENELANKTLRFFYFCFLF
jgi:hypothetical protein